VANTTHGLQELNVADIGI